MLVDGKWNSDWQPVQGSDEKGRFIRQTSTFRRWITPDGSLGPEGQEALTAEPDRFHLVVGYICPWASRTLMARALKELEDVISVSIVDPRLSNQGWRFGDFPGSDATDNLIGATHVHEFYTASDERFTGRATIPILWDKKERAIVNNESADIIRILNSGFGALASSTFQLRPENLIGEIDALNDTLYDGFNNGVYKAGFASSQYAYEEAYSQVFESLDALNSRLEDGRPFLLGGALTESDIRAFVTLIRFDAAYVGLFKTNRSRVADFPLLQAYLKRLLDLPGVRRTVHIDHIKAGIIPSRRLIRGASCRLVPICPNWGSEVTGFQPPLFVSHGAPDLAIADIPAARFIRSMFETRPLPDGVVIMSAHWESHDLAITTAPHLRTIYDFGGFSQALYQILYPARSAEWLASKIKDRLNAPGRTLREDRERGLDHGAWVPLRLMFPEGSIPITQLSLPRSISPERLFGIGQSLSALADENILLVGSGSSVHNLRRITHEGSPAPEWAQAFDDWTDNVLAKKNLEALYHFQRAPYGALAHPTPEHFLPLIFTAGARRLNDDAARTRRLHHSYSYGSIGMSSWEFAREA